MTITLSNDTSNEHQINNQSENINKKIIAPTNNNTDVTLHNQIYNLFIKYVNKNKTMNDDYFKTTLTCIYNDVYNKTLVWKDIPIVPTVQVNIKQLLTDYSYSKIYETLQYYVTTAKKITMSDTNILELTALFFSTLHFFIKRKLNSEQESI